MSIDSHWKIQCWCPTVWHALHLSPLNEQLKCLYAILRMNHVWKIHLENNFLFFHNQLLHCPSAKSAALGTQTLNDVLQLTWKYILYFVYGPIFSRLPHQQLSFEWNYIPNQAVEVRDKLSLGLLNYWIKGLSTQFFTTEWYTAHSFFLIWIDHLCM